MPTNNERREVARRMHEAADRWYQFDFGCVRDILGIDEWLSEGCYYDNGVLWRQLASYVEPEPERTCHVVATERKVSQTQTMVSKSCSFCGHVFGSEEHRPFLPGAGDEIVLYEVSIPNYCPNCGAKVVGDD